MAAWREHEAQERDLPRGRILRDDCLADIAATAPISIEALARCRGVGAGIAGGKLGPGILNAVNKVLEELGPRYATRPGGYTRILKLGARKGDGAEVAQIQLVK